MHILLLENIDQNACKIFKANHHNVIEQKKSLNEGELIDIINRNKIEILGIRSKTNVTKNVFSSCPSLLVVGAYCIGTNQIDLESATIHGVAVFNAPYSNGRSVSELVIAETIMLTRRIPEKNYQMHTGVWNKSTDGAREIRGKTLGIIGYGNIGSQVSVLAEAIGMQVCFYDLQEKPALGNAHKCQTLNELLSISDIITIHVDGREQNKYLISEKEIEIMKQGAILLNLSRGFVVNSEDLKKVLKTNKLGGVGLDVFEVEPRENGSYSTGFEDYNNLILTPHIGGSTQEAQQAIALFVPKQILTYLHEGNTSLCLNLPKITPVKKEKNNFRFIHLHKNIPGIMAQINQILSEAQLNIEGQYLKTDGNIGYVVTDINRELDNNTLSNLKSINETICCHKL